MYDSTLTTWARNNNNDDHPSKFNQEVERVQENYQKYAQDYNDESMKPIPNQNNMQNISWL